MKSNLYSDLNVPARGEAFEELLTCGNVRIERIVSSDSPDDKEYNQEHDEWVLVLKGSATVAMCGEDVQLAEGDHLFIPRGTAHRVTRTDHGTVWLAVHMKETGFTAA